MNTRLASAKRQLRKPLVKRYLVVGAGAYLTEMLTVLILKRYAHWSAVRTVAVSFWVGFMIAFLLQKLVTFRDYDHSAKAVFKQLGGYSLLTVWNYAFTLIIVRLLSPVISVFIVRTITIITIACWNFVIYTKLFKEPELW